MSAIDVDGGGIEVDLGLAIVTVDAQGALPADELDSAAAALLGGASATTTAVQTQAVAAGSSVFAPKATGGRVAGSGFASLGDSISALGGSNATTGADGDVTWALIEAGGKLPYRGTYATGGYTAEQIRDIKLTEVLALSPLPAVARVLAGTNNVPDGTDVSALDTIYRTLLTAGVRPIACTIPPRGDSAPANNNVDIWNHKVRTLAAELGIDLVDYHAVLTNPSTGGYKTGHGQTDNIHPSFLGLIKMGEALAAVLTAKLPATSPPLARRASEFGNLIGTAGLMLTDALGTGNNTAGDGIADNWRDLGNAGNTRSITTDADGTHWQKVSVPVSGGGGANIQYNSGGGGLSLAGRVAAGDVVEFVCRVRTTGFEESLVAPVTGGVGGTGPAWSVLLEYLMADGTTYGSLVRNPYVGHANVADGVVWARSVVPAGANGTLRISVTTSGAPVSGVLTLEFTAVAVRNLTALGLA